jgi:hypothetical protein
MVQRPDWAGRTVVCIASGPSLTAKDCELVRASGHPVVVTNTTFRLCPWADALFGFDAKWWKLYRKEVGAVFKGRCFTASPVAAKYGPESLWGVPWFRIYRNSGACAVSLALSGGAAKVVMLGFDAGWDGTKRHWHGDHPAGLENAGTMGDWPRQFEGLAKYAGKGGIPVVNASRRTRLACFPRGELEAEL